MVELACFEDIMKKSRKIRKLSVRKLQVVRLENREAPSAGGSQQGWCQDLNYDNLCDIGGQASDSGYVLDAPPSFEAQSYGSSMAASAAGSSACLFSYQPAPNAYC
jgi:hypothetical protein